MDDGFLPLGFNRNLGPVIQFPRKHLKLIAMIIIAGVILFMSSYIFEQVDAGEICIIQNPITGTLYIYTTQGIKLQLFGKVTKYNKSMQYWFSAKKDQGSPADESIKIRFNDGGHANVSGSVRVDLPLDDKHLTLIHTKYGSQRAIMHELVRTIIEKSVYMSGPLMSSTESYAARRNELLGYIEDQAQDGVFATTSVETKVKDPLTGADKTVTVVELIKRPDAPNGIVRRESSPLKEFNIRVYSLSINAVTYDDVVEKQIAAQQAAIMDVQTAIANAKKAEQQTLTVEQTGKASAAQAKWEQEVLKAKAVTQAEQERDVARLTLDAARFKKEAAITEGEGEARKKELIMAADGALTQKLAVYESVMKTAVTELAKQKWVPEVVMGGGSAQTNGATAFNDMLGLLSYQVLKSINTDIQIGKTKPPEKAK
ncbi:MAG: hypothetical protein HQL02_08830 [Nitrospirae bacterium]|nr:hypothetical protein [Nitrospirota bacterium]